jgi:cupin fold WbuC family metalloprotein
MEPKPMLVFPHALLDDLASKASASPRGRAHHNIHASPADPVQRFFVVANRNSYFRPHRHHTRSELALVLRGAFDVLTFDDLGVVQARWPVGEGQASFAYETPRMTWHTLLARSDGAAFVEVKEGPYDPATAVEFAPWAPAEADATADVCREWIRGAQPGERYAPR